MRRRGRISKSSLTIGIEGLDLNHPLIVKLMKQGHTLVDVSAIMRARHLDLIIGPHCWRTLPGLKYLQVTSGKGRKFASGIEENDASANE